MQVVKSAKTKLYPTATQKEMLFKMFNAKRFIFNTLLGMVRAHHFGSYAKDPSKPNIPSKNKLIKEITKLKKIHPWLYYTPNSYLQAAAADLFAAFKGFYKGGGYPNFKSRKYHKQTINMYAGSEVRITNGNLFIPNRLDNPIKFSQHFEFPEDSKITGFTITKDAVGEYWLSVTFKFEVEDKELGELNPVGCDLGLKESLITSSGKVYPRLRITKQYEKKLARAQKSLSRKKKGSKNRNKARIKVAKIHRNIARIREHNNHCISRDLVSSHNFISLESLKIKNMVKNRKLSKAIHDVAWGQLVGFIKYKQVENQGLFHQIDTFFPSSKMCSCCGNVKSKLALSERSYNCSECGTTIDRDFNASVNIVMKGLIDSGYTELEATELLRNSQELFKIKSVESEVRPLVAQDYEAERMACLLRQVI